MQHAGVCYKRKFVSKRAYVSGGWYVLEENYTMKNHVNVPTSPNVPTGGYVSKRNLLCNRPQYNQIKFNNVNKLISPLNGVPNWEETFLQKHTVNT